MSKVRFTKSTADIYASNKLQKKGWVHINDGYIYIARDKGRSYWILRNIPPDDRPIIHFNDETKTIRIGTNKIIIKSPSKYIEAKNNLEPYSKKKHSAVTRNNKNTKKRNTKKKNTKKKNTKKKNTKKRSPQYVKGIDNSELRKYGLGPNKWYYKN